MTFNQTNTVSQTQLTQIPLYWKQILNSNWQTHKWDTHNPKNSIDPTVFSQLNNKQTLKLLFEGT